MPGTAHSAHRIPGRDRRGRAYEHRVPSTISDLVTIPRLAKAETSVRALDELASTTPAAGPAVRSLLTTESLAGRQIRALAIGRRVTPGPDTDRSVRRFEQACHDGTRAPALDRALLLEAHRRIVPGGGTPRRRTAWIGRVDSPADSIYVPPPATEVDRLLTDLLAFLRRDDLCPVAQTMATAGSAAGSSRSPSAGAASSAPSHHRWASTSPVTPTLSPPRSTPTTTATSTPGAPSPVKPSEHARPQLAPSLPQPRPGHLTAVSQDCP
jgi:hypothetical protein